MNWSGDKSVALSKVCVILFAIILAGLDVGAYWLVSLFVAFSGMGGPEGLLMMISVYLCSAFAWPVLWMLWRLLGNVGREQVFITKNVSCLRAVSWCCAGAAAVCLVSAAYYLPFLMAAAASGFMALIVRIVKNAFQQALLMKDELDLTV